MAADRAERTPDDEPPGPGSDPPTGATVHPAALARNWRTVLLVDALMGVAVVVAGAVLAVVWNLVAGGLLGSVGVWYVYAVARRARRWASWRAEAGL